MAAALAFFAAGAASLPAGETHVSLVPWKVLAHDDVVDAPLVLFWVPASPDDLRRSPLLASEELTLYASRCVAMRVVRVDDRARLARLSVGDAIPIAILTTREGEIVGQVEGARVAEVETLVREELDRRAAEADALLDRARERAENDEVGAAIVIYEKVWESRCTCPRQGRDAGRALKKLRR